VLGVNSGSNRPSLKELPSETTDVKACKGQKMAIGKKLISVKHTRSMSSVAKMQKTTSECPKGCDQQIEHCTSIKVAQGRVAVLAAVLQHESTVLICRRPAICNILNNVLLLTGPHFE